MSLILSGSDGLSDIDGSASTPAIRGTDANTGIFFPAADTIGFAEGGAEVMRIDSSGRVGIGTTSTGAKLQVNGNTAQYSASIAVRTPPNQYEWGHSNTAGYGSVIGAETGSGVPFIAFSAGAGTTSNTYRTFGLLGVVLRTDNAGALLFSSATNANADNQTLTERMRIDSSGNLLVGTITAEGRATIRGSTSDATAFTFSTEAQDGTDQLRVRCDGAVYMGLDGSSPYNLTNGAAANAVLLSDGFLYRSTSSLRYKRDIQDLTHGLSKTLELRPVTYKGISPSDGENVYGGFIAEEVHAAGLSEFVQYDNKGQPDALHYGNMVALCVKAIQELKAELDTVKAQNAAFEARLAALEAK